MITEDRDNLTNLLLDKHNHDNKTILDGILQAQVDNWNETFTDKHTHENKTVIDKFTESNDGKVLYNGEQITKGIIDDSATDATNKTWSAKKISEYVDNKAMYVSDESNEYIGSKEHCTMFLQYMATL